MCDFAPNVFGTILAALENAPARVWLENDAVWIPANGVSLGPPKTGPHGPQIKGSVGARAHIEGNDERFFGGHEFSPARFSAAIVYRVDASRQSSSM